MSKRTEQIVELERQAARHDGKASGLHWQAAELVAAELATGKTAAKLAEQIGKSSSWVTQAAKVWRRWGGNLVADRPPWGDALHGHATTGGHAAVQRSSVPKDPAERMALVRKILPSLGPDQAAEVQHAAKLRREGLDISPAGRKAAAARGAELAEPLERAVKGMASIMAGSAVESALADATDALRELIADEALRPAELRKIERAHEAFVAVLAEAVSAVEVGSS